MYVCMYVCVCVYACVYVCMYVCVYVCMYVCVFVCMCICMYVCMYVCTYVCMYVCMYVCLYVCMCVSLTNTYHWIQLFVLLVEYLPLCSMRPHPPGQLAEDIHWIPGLLLKASTDSIVDKILQLQVMI